MCKYCDSDFDLYLLDTMTHLSYKGDFYPGVRICVDGNMLSIDAVADTHEPNYIEECIPIIYCPMCGRKL